VFQEQLARVADGTVVVGEDEPAAILAQERAQYFDEVDIFLDADFTTFDILAALVELLLEGGVNHFDVERGEVQLGGNLGSHDDDGDGCYPEPFALSSTSLLDNELPEGLHTIRA